MYSVPDCWCFLGRFHYTGSQLTVSEDLGGSATQVDKQTKNGLSGLKASCGVSGADEYPDRSAGSATRGSQGESGQLWGKQENEMKTNKSTDNVVALETVLTCGECEGRLWLVVERHDTDGPICRCVNCGAEYE